MNNFIEVDENTYSKFDEWAKENIEGVYQHSIMVADRVVVKDGSDKLIAYMTVGYHVGFHIREDMLNKSLSA